MVYSPPIRSQAAAKARQLATLDAYLRIVNAMPAADAAQVREYVAAVRAEAAYYRTKARDGGQR